MASHASYRTALKFSAVVSIIVVVTFAGTSDGRTILAWSSLAIAAVIASTFVPADEAANIANDPGVWALIAVLVGLAWARVFMRPHRAALRSAIVAYVAEDPDSARTSKSGPDEKSTRPDKSSA